MLLSRLANILHVLSMEVYSLHLGREKRALDDARLIFPTNTQLNAATFHGKNSFPADFPIHSTFIYIQSMAAKCSYPG